VDDVFPWWVRALQEPATILSSLTAFLLVSGGPSLWEAGRSFFSSMASLFGRLPAFLELLPGDAAGAWTLTLSVLPPLCVGSYLLFRLFLTMGTVRSAE
jgi:hypothetical protein